MISGLKVIKIGNDYVTLHFAYVLELNGSYSFILISWAPLIWLNFKLTDAHSYSDITGHLSQEAKQVMDSCYSYYNSSAAKLFSMFWT